MKRKPTLYIVDKYKDGTDDLEETVSFPIYRTNEQSLLPYMNKNCDIWLGRYNKRRGKLFRLEPLRFGDNVEQDRCVFLGMEADYKEQCEQGFAHQEQPNEDYFEGLNDYLEGTMGV